MSSKEKASKSGIQFSVGDTVVVRLDAKKFSVVFVHKKTDTICSGSIIKYAPYEEVILEFTRKQVVCNLGENPAQGSIYGQHVEPFFRTTTSEMGTVHFFYASSKNEKDKLVERLNKGYHSMKSKGLGNIFPIMIELRPPKGTFDGHYKIGKRGDHDTMCIRPKDEIDFNHIMYHELGHPIWSYLFNDSIRSKWIRAYHRQVKISKLTAKDSRALLKKLQDDRLIIKEFSAALDDGDKAVLKELIKYVKKIHNLSQHDIDTMILAGEDISEFWPTTEMEISEMLPAVSDYGTKSPCEFWSESFSNYMCKTALPDKVSKLMEKSLQSVAGTKKASSD